MPTSLAAQLAQAVSLNAPLLSESARKKHRGTSYLFTSTSAQTEDIESIHALAINALGQLRLIYPAFRDLDSTENEIYQLLFSSKAKETDRTLLSRDEAKALDDALKYCLRILGPCLQDSAAGKVIEWLVRRFRVNEFNVPDVLALFFPYHESPHFAKMVSILQLEHTNFAFLKPFKQAAKPLPRNVLAEAMRKDVDLARFMINLLPDAYGGDQKPNAVSTVHRTLLAFNLATLLEFVTRVNDDGLDAGTLSFLLPSLLTPLRISNVDGVAMALRKDGILGSFVLLSALSQKTSFTSQALTTIVTSMVKSTTKPAISIEPSQLLTAIISVLAPQTTLPILPSNICDALIKIPGFGKAMQNALGWNGSTKVISLLIPHLTERVKVNENAAAVTEQLFSSENVSEELVTLLAKALLESSLSANEEGGKKLELLSMLRQRHPKALQKCVDAIGREDKEKALLAENVLLKISMSGGGANDVMLAAADADPSVRCAATRSVIQRIIGDDLTETELLSLQDSVRARLLDVYPSVLQVIYEEEKMAVSLFTQSPDLLSSICTFLTSQPPSRALLRTHLHFFSNALYNAQPDFGLKVILSLIFHFALLSKPRQKTAASVWEIVCGSSLSKHAILKDVSEIVEPVFAPGDGKSSLEAEEMASINAALITRLAENVKASDCFDIIVEWISESISPGASSVPNDSHLRLGSLLVGGTLVSNLTGNHQIQTSRKLLEVLSKSAELNGFEGDSAQEEFSEGAFEDDLFKNVVLKPNSRTTLQKAQLRLIARISSAKQPHANEQVNWFCGSVNANPSSPDAYVMLMRDVFATINALRSPAFVSHTNKKLYENIGSKVLLFFAGLWTSTAPRITSVTKYVALKHALAFLQAQQSAEVHVDFQVIIPSLICALQDPEKRVRAAAMACLSLLGSSLGGPKTSDVYAFDSVYGKSSDSLQFVDAGDSLHYVQTLVEHRDHIANDSNYIAYIHNKELSYAKSDSKKDAKYKQRILCFLLSHVVSLPSKQTKIGLLRCLKEVHNSVKLHMLAATLNESLKLGENLLEGETCDTVLLGLSAFDSTCVKDLSADQSTSWSLLLNCIKSFHRLGQANLLWTSLLSNIGTIYSALPNSRQHDLCMTLIGLGSSSDDSVWGIKPFLRKCIKQAVMFTSILKDLRPSTAEARLREAKRSKLDSTPPDDSNFDLSRLTFFAEALVSQQLPGSLELVAELLEVLGQVVNGATASHSETGYVEQLLMTAVDSCASQVKELPNLSPNAIQLDVLVKLMRTDNPQTFNQALLLMASLARLSSESVLQNVLPIFTFMGSNVFHRDDSYSFKVIQKTTEGIVPVVMSSLRQRFTNNHDLHIGTRDLLKTFTDAATHVPRHRRINFFNHLIDVMSPADFLAPTCMLLVDKVSAKVARQNPRDAFSTLSLPISIFEHHAPAIRLLALQEVIAEVRRILGVLDGDDTQEKPFLEDTVGDEPTSVILTRQRQCRSLIAFVGHALKELPSKKFKANEHEDMRSILASLVGFSTSRVDARGGNDLSEISRWSLLNALETIRVDEFASAILSMVQGVDKKLQEGSLLLLTERFPDIAPSARERIQSTTAQILDCIQHILQSLNDSSLLKSALDALQAIAITAQAKDETPLAALVPTILKLVHEQLGNASVISVLPTIISKVGPRMIPHLRSTVDTCVFVASSNSSTEVLAEDFNTLTALISSIPTFWGSVEVKAICEICISDKAGSLEFAHLADKLVKALSKHLSSKMLLASLLELWPSVEFVAAPKGEQRTGRFFDVLKRCIHHSPKAEILEVLRTMFTHFLQSFDYRVTVPLSDLAVENKVISAYMELVIKLNETTFQPLFRRSCDWAFGADSNNGRKNTFFRTFTSLLDLFKDLMTPYMTFVIEPVAELLRLFGTEVADDQPLWKSCLENLSKCLAVDEGTFWNDDRVRTIYDPVVQQIPICIGLKIENGKALLTDCLLSLVGCADGDPLLKAINLAIIQHSKSEDARIRLYSLSCSVAVWEKFGRKLSAFGIQTATFVMECSEDDNDDVVRECRRLRDAIEAQVGKIEGL
ncbi:hypothetical protein SCHPADRAFT_845947 [Schizopora paradoxa]|uniref:U3 small nucleolar RNA-associated protein 10 n=1 Tax=Schizopora paradoxa TaxID=27342 RepID=A0A0H2SKU4_9AGAM|nr:hypothetical protein SCHPADRAFT_845947 [Schizopora paradoxa]